MRAVFLDRDGVINRNCDDYVKSYEEFVLLPGSLEALRRLADSSFLVVVVTNQSIVGRGLVSRCQVEAIHNRMIEAVQTHGGRIDAVFYCPHRPEEDCGCRKPKPGLLLRAAEELEIDLRKSYLVGDAASDIRAGLAVGCETCFVLSGREPALDASRFPTTRVFHDLADAVDWILCREG